MSNDDYSDIINLDYPALKKHSYISMEMRAAQFSPFAALTGLEKKMEDTGKQAEQNVLDSEKNDIFWD